MQRRFLLFLLLLPTWAMAQVKFGYISYNEVCRQMPQYAEAQKQLSDLKAKYEAEAQRSETEFQRKFSDFLQGQKDFPANILQKRQAELQDLMDRSVAFRKEAELLLDSAQAQMLGDVRSALNAAVTSVATDRGYAFVLNTDGDAVPFISPALGEDVTDFVRLKLGIIKELPKEEVTTEAQDEEASTDSEEKAEPAETSIPADAPATTPSTPNEPTTIPATTPSTSSETNDTPATAPIVTAD